MCKMVDVIPAGDRAQYTMVPFFWYAPIQPAWGQQNREKLRAAFTEVSTDVRRAFESTLMCMGLLMTGASLGTFDDFEWIIKTVNEIRCDAEAPDDIKFTQYCFKNFLTMYYCWYMNDDNRFAESWENITVKAKALFPKAKNDWSKSAGILLWTSFVLAPVAWQANDLDAALSHVRDLFSPLAWMIWNGMGGNAIWEVQNIMPAMVLADLHKAFTAKNDTETVAELSGYMRRMRALIERFQLVSPGSFCCSGVVGVAHISRTLKDRDLNVELKKMKEALVFAKNLGFLPVDVATLQTQIGAWTADVTLVQEAFDYYEKIGYKRYSVGSASIIERIKSGKLQVLDLDSGIVAGMNVSKSSTGAGQLAELDAAIAAARAHAHEAEAAGDEDEEDEARSKLKKLKKKRKTLQKEIESGGNTTSTVDPAVIAELEKKIADARARAHTAEEEEDDDAEEAARKELKVYKKELSQLLGKSKKNKSIDAAKVLDAKIIDASSATTPE